MKRFYLFISVLLFSIMGWAQGLPQASTDDNTIWYLIQFMNGGNAITAESSGANITTSKATGSDAQLWKLTGNSGTGYTFTNKKGYTLCVSSASKEVMVQAKSTASGVKKFVVNPTSNSAFAGGYEIQPTSNSSISFNLWGGPAENRGVGLWDKGDQNNPVKFVKATDFEQLGKISIIPYPQKLELGNGNL
jgi:hypothetical protein